MKNVSLLFTMLLTASSVFAHQLPVPHAHDGYFHGWETFVILLAIAIIMIFGLKKIFSVVNRSNK